MQNKKAKPFLKLPLMSLLEGKFVYQATHFGFLFLFLLFATIYNIYINNNNTFATGDISDSTITINTSGNITFNITPTTTGNTVASSDYSFSVSTNNYTGYTLRIMSQDNTGRISKSNCANGNPTKCYFSSIASANTTITNNNTWGYKPSYYNSSPNTSLFYPSPSTTGQILNRTNTANATDTQDNYTLSISARANSELEPGVYTKTFIITAVGNPIDYTISYTDNSGDGDTVGLDVSNLPSTQQGSVNHGTAFASLTPNTTPARGGYDFVGWCSVKTTNNGTVCPGTTYTYNSVNNNYGNIDISEIADNSNLTLYALWSIAAYNITIKTATGISSVSLNGVSCSSTSGCVVPSLSYGATYVLTATLSNANQYAFSGWSNSASKGSIADASSDSTTFTVGNGSTILTPSATIRSYLQRTFVRYENIDGSWSDYTAVPVNSMEVDYGSSYSYTRAADETFQIASVDSYVVTGPQDNYLSVYRNIVTCTKQYRLENADGSWGDYLSDGIITTRYGGSCSYTKPVTNYKGTSTGANDSSGTASATNVTSTQSLFISMFRNKYTLTLDKDSTSISSVSGGTTKRWGESVSISATPATNYKFSSWSITSGSGSIANSSSASTTFTFTTSSATVKATGVLDLGLCSSQGSCMQFSNSCDTTLTDARDGQTYSVATINGQCYMTRNIAIGCAGSGSNYSSTATSKSLTSQFSNVAYTASNPWSTPTLGLSTSSSDYDNPYLTCDSTYGAWYNYAAASAGTITGSTNTTTDTYNICPKGWTIPTEAQFNALKGTGYLSSYLPTYGGYYWNGSIVNANGIGQYWSTDTGSDSPGQIRRVLSYQYSSPDQAVVLRIMGINRGSYGVYVRCVRQ
jgi:uncharacterized protein (TIGR02145 family)